MDDYLFVSGYMRNLAEEHKDKIPVAAYERLIYRSESYLFFLLARLLRFPYEKGVIDKTIDKMMAQGVYPIRRPNPRYYSGLKYPLVTYVVNRKWLLKISNYLLSAILYNEH